MEGPCVPLAPAVQVDLCGSLVPPCTTNSHAVWPLILSFISDFGHASHQEINLVSPSGRIVGQMIFHHPLQLVQSVVRLCINAIDDFDKLIIHLSSSFEELPPLQRMTTSLTPVLGSFMLLVVTESACFRMLARIIWPFGVVLVARLATTVMMTHTTRVARVVRINCRLAVGKVSNWRIGESRLDTRVCRRARGVHAPTLCLPAPKAGRR
mmetsp:Transcript_49831/g.117186  ORF Transcript_49831/g.117186 Transcript_49831/m.117186 type:complete len:210 (+) Transcript_49831:629-1258(+)